MKLIIFLLASLFIFTGLIGFINSPNDLNINIKHNPYPVNVNNSVSYVREFPINLNNIPSGTGYYQQLITIGNASYPYSNYNINSQGSNIQFISQNNSYLYAWVQNINTTTISVWIKNFNSSNTINMQVFPEFENLFSATGYLGEASYINPNYDNFNLVAKNGQITVNNKSFITEVFSNYLTNLTFSNLTASNNTITSRTISGSNLSTTITGFASTQLTTNNYTTLGWQREFNKGVYWINASMVENFLNGNPNNVILTTTKNPIFNSIGIQEEGYYSLLTGSFNSTTVSYGPYTSFYNTTNEINFNNDTIISYVHYWYSQYGKWSNNTNFVIFNPEYWNFQMLYILSSGGQQNTQTPIFNISYNNLNLIKSKTTKYLPDSPFLLPNNVMPTFTIGAFTNMTDHAVASYLSNSITIPMPNWFNLTLKAYTNYSFTFHYNNTPLYFTYDGLINNTIYTGFLDSNLTLDIHFIALGYSGKTELIVGR